MASLAARDVAPQRSFRVISGDVAGLPAPSVAAVVACASSTSGMVAMGCRISSGGSRCGHRRCLVERLPLGSKRSGAANTIERSAACL